MTTFWSLGGVEKKLDSAKQRKKLNRTQFDIVVQKFPKMFLELDRLLSSSLSSCSCWSSLNPVHSRSGQLSTDGFIELFLVLYILTVVHGQITMWDLANGKLLRTITDAHPPGTAILHVKVRAAQQNALNDYRLKFEEKTSSDWFPPCTMQMSSIIQ